MNQYLILFEEEIYEVYNWDAKSAFEELVEHLHSLGFVDAGVEDLTLTNGTQPEFKEEFIN